MTGGITAARSILGVLAGLVLAAGGCRQLNESHCGNQKGDATCEQRNPTTPFCDRCEAANDGCVAEAVTQVGCGFEASNGTETTVALTTAASEEVDAGTESSVSEGVDSSSSGPNLCGNGMIDEGEDCDGEPLPEGTPDCAAMAYGEGTPTCQDDCTISYMMCPAYMEECGNGEVGEEEQCDGTNLANQTCDDFPQHTGDGLVCTESCMFNISGCMTCLESDEACSPMGQPCCNANEECLGLGMKRCCVNNGLGLCA